MHNVVRYTIFIDRTITFYFYGVNTDSNKGNGSEFTMDEYMFRFFVYQAIYCSIV